MLLVFRCEMVASTTQSSLPVYVVILEERKVNSEFISVLVIKFNTFDDLRTLTKRPFDLIGKMMHAR